MYSEYWVEIGVRGAAPHRNIRTGAERKDGLLSVLRRCHSCGGADPLFLGHLFGGKSHWYGNLATTLAMGRSQLCCRAFYSASRKLALRVVLGRRKPVRANVEK